MTRTAALAAGLVGLVCGLGLVLLPVEARAGDAPHDLSSASPVACDSCHILHRADGGSLTRVEGNHNLCASCHTGRGEAFVLPESAQAVMGVSGTSHRFTAPVVNPAAGATTPLDPELASRIPEGNLQCSTCHDQHTNPTTPLWRGSQRIGPGTSVTVGVPMTATAGGATGTLVLNQPAPDANPKGYRVEVVTAGALGASKFRVSNDNGISWYGWSSGWLPGAPNGQSTGANVELNDGNKVTVTFSGTFAVGDRWNFYVSYPLLRMPVDQSQMCETCHTGRVQTSAQVETGADGVHVFSHPVGEALAKSYDRASNAILDADGQLQSGAGDGLKTNNLLLDTNSKVRCLTCHSQHHADSNSLTEDPR